MKEPSQLIKIELKEDDLLPFLNPFVRQLLDERIFLSADFDHEGDEEISDESTFMVSVYVSDYDEYRLFSLRDVFDEIDDLTHARVAMKEIDRLKSFMVDRIKELEAEEAEQ